jgi:PHP family Zn ribbon phosphoesterase
MITELLGAAQSVQSLFTLLKAAKGLANYNEIVAAVSEVNVKLMEANSVALSAQAEQAVLTGRLKDLETKLAEYENWERTAADYELKDLAHGVYAYVYNPVSGGGARHWACAKCFQERKRHVLQKEYPPCYKCPNCGTEIEPIKGGALVQIEEAY